MNVTILGTEYQIFYETLAENKKFEDCGGYCEYYAKEIHVRKHTDEEPDHNAKCLGIFEQKVLRHELIHAFLYESGLSVNSNDTDQWAVNEEMVDWLAIQIPKIMEAYEQVVKPKKTMVDVSYIGGHTETIELDDIDSYE